MQYRPRHRQLSSVLCFAEFFTYFVSCSLCAGVSVPAPRRYKELNHDMGIVPQRIDWVKSHLQQTSARRKLDFFHVSSALVRIQHSRQCLDHTEPTNFQRIKRLGSKHRIFFWASRDVLELVHLGTSWYILAFLGWTFWRGFCAAEAHRRGRFGPSSFGGLWVLWRRTTCFGFSGTSSLSRSGTQMGNRYQDAPGENHGSKVDSEDCSCHI